MPDFDDFETEQQALNLAANHPDALLALDFLIGWNSLPRAAALVVGRLDELNDRRYNVLRPAAETLGIDYPVAATLLYRHLGLGPIKRIPMGVVM